MSLQINLLLVLVQEVDVVMGLVARMDVAGVLPTTTESGKQQM